MRATILATVLFALAAGVDARGHKQRGQCKPKHHATPAVSVTASPSVEVGLPTSSATPVVEATTTGSSTADSASAVPSTTASDSAIDPATSVEPTSAASSAASETTTESASPTAAEPSVEATAEPTSAEPTEATTTTSSAPAEATPTEANKDLFANLAATSGSSEPAQTTEAAKPQSNPTGGEVWPGVNDPGATGPASMQQQLVDLHNTVRAKYSAPPLVWDQSLAEFAAGHSDSCKMEHSPGNVRPGGENLSANTQASLPALFQGWADEEVYYDWANPGQHGIGGNVIGHWTQLVWKETQKVGCAWKTCADGTIFTGYGPSTYLVCEYYPSGNMQSWSGNDEETKQYYSSNIGPKA